MDFAPFGAVCSLMFPHCLELEVLFEDHRVCSRACGLRTTRNTTYNSISQSLLPSPNGDTGDAPYERATVKTRGSVALAKESRPDLAAQSPAQKVLKETPHQDQWGPRRRLSSQILDPAALALHPRSVSGGTTTIAAPNKLH